MGVVGVWAYREYDQTGSALDAALLATSLTFVSVGSWDNYVIAAPSAQAQQKNGEKKSSELKKKSWLVGLVRMMRKRKTKTSLVTSPWKIIFTIGEAAVQYNNLNNR